MLLLCQWIWICGIRHTNDQWSHLSEISRYTMCTTLYPMVLKHCGSLASSPPWSCFIHFLKWQRSSNAKFTAYQILFQYQIIPKKRLMTIMKPPLHKTKRGRYGSKRGDMGQIDQRQRVFSRSEIQWCPNHKNTILRPAGVRIKSFLFCVSILWCLYPWDTHLYLH